MTGVDELFDSKTPMGSDLEAGVRAIALNQKIEFRLYARVVLPVDGFIFWVRVDVAAQGAPAALLTAAQQQALQQAESMGEAVEVIGSLHYDGDVRQDEGELWSQNRVIFTSTEEVNDLREVGPDFMWIGEFETLRFAFSSLSGRYRQAGLWHYAGIAVYPDAGPNIIDDLSQFSEDQVVSNSLPAWLALQTYNPAWAFWRPAPAIFPSMTPPLNAAPPFVTVHVLPDSTQALTSAPTISRSTSSHQQLCEDTVRLTFWGMRNAAALDFVDMVYRYSLDTAAFGIMNQPAIRDDKRGQSELGLVTMKKTIEFRVSYLQATMRNVAQQVIKSAKPTFLFG
jgi:hypothetical protein